MRAGTLIWLRGECWRIVHVDFRRDYYTLERARRWLKGRYWPLAGQALVQEALASEEEQTDAS